MCDTTTVFLGYDDRSSELDRATDRSTNNPLQTDKLRWPRPLEFATLNLRPTPPRREEPTDPPKFAAQPVVASSVDPANCGGTCRTSIEVELQ